MEYFENPPLLKTGGLCSDRECPCDETPIAAGEGYLYITRECCNFRWDCRTVDEVDTKLELLGDQTNSVIIPGPGLANPTLVCEVGARRRQLNLDVAGRDAKHWWATGQVPFRPTPRVGEPEVPFSKQGVTSQTQGGCFIATAACGHTLEPEVKILRAFRDLILRQWFLGRMVIHIYERVSPPFAQWLAPHPVARRLVRSLIVHPCATIFNRVLQVHKRLP
jgi:hypothetical protein